jgi:hypothetical protein
MRCPLPAAALLASALVACGPSAEGADKSFTRDAGDAGPTPCAILLARTCSPDGGPAACATAAACEAARLLDAYDPDRCAEMLEDGVHYGGCTGARSSCWLLTQKCCGSLDGCRDSAGCQNARAVAGSGQDPACLQAYSDDTAFPRCVPPRG